jgi:REP element-mobilizing transposase RayT
MTLVSSPVTRRRTLRLPATGVAAPAVFLITLVTAGRECLFGAVSAEGTLMLNAFGWMVQREWLRTGFMRPELELDTYVVMPNHLHAVLAVAPGPPVAAAPIAPIARVAEPVLALDAAPPQRVLGAAVAGFKAMCTVQINHRRGRPGATVWQRGFVERVIRSGPDLEIARRHVEQNPERWARRLATP